MTLTYVVIGSYIALLFLAYGWAGLPFTYLASSLFDVPSSGLVWLTMFNIISGATDCCSVTNFITPSYMY